MTTPQKNLQEGDEMPAAEHEWLVLQNRLKNMNFLVGSVGVG